MTGRERLEGADAVRAALAAATPLALVLVRRAGLSAAAQEVVDAARVRSVAVRPVSDSVLHRFSTDWEDPAEILALVGLSPHATLPELMERPGDVWLLTGIRYPGNVGGAIRTLEVAGAAGVVVDTPLEPAGRRRAVRASMRADRLFPVLFEEAAGVVAAARAVGRVVIALETSGTEAALDGLPDAALIVAGGERDGLPAPVLAAADRVLRLPTRGFIPSFNVQAAIAMVAASRARSG